jgi:hypothetical protein
MDAIVIDPGLLACLTSAKGPVRLKTAAGEVLGDFTPAKMGGSEPPPLSEEELRKRETRKEGRTWSEIKVDLEKRG